MRTPSLEQIQYMEDHTRDTKLPGIIASCSVCLTSACLVVGLRFVSRRIGKVKLEANDWLIVLALVKALFREFAGSGFNTVTDSIFGIYCRVCAGNTIRYGKAPDHGHESKGFGYSMYFVSYTAIFLGNAY